MSWEMWFYLCPFLMAEEGISFPLSGLPDKLGLGGAICPRPRPEQEALQSVTGADNLKH